MSAAGAGIAGDSGQSMAALELLANPQRLQAKIDQLKAAEDSAREQIALAGPASEILSIRANIDADREAAQKALDDALDKSEAIVEEAKTQARLIVDKATQESAQLVSESESRNESAKLLLEKAQHTRASVESEQQKLKAKWEELDAYDKSLQQRAADLDQSKRSLEGDQARLAKARDAIEAAL